MPIDFEKECFFIAPIGEDDSPIRKRSDGVRDFVVKEAAEAHGLQARRDDDVDEPGQITSQIVEHCLRARMCIADLTEGNPNVYYELSVRHGKQLPVVLIAETGTKLPFDVGQARVIFFEHDDLSSAIRAREGVKTQIGAALSSEAPADNPIANGLRLAALEDGTNEDRALALVMERLERLTVITNNLAAQVESQHLTPYLSPANEEFLNSTAARLGYLKPLESSRSSKVDPALLARAIKSLEREIKRAGTASDEDQPDEGPEAPDE